MWLWASLAIAGERSALRLLPNISEKTVLGWLLGSKWDILIPVAFERLSI
jgi:hypothetical protein